MTGCPSISASRGMRNVVLNVRIIETRRFRLRIWCGGKIMRFAAWVMGCRAEIVLAHEEVA